MCQACRGAWSSLSGVTAKAKWRHMERVFNTVPCGAAAGFVQQQIPRQQRGLDMHMDEGQLPSYTEQN